MIKAPTLLAVALSLTSCMAPDFRGEVVEPGACITMSDKADPQSGCTWALIDWHQTRALWTDLGYSLEGCERQPEIKVIDSPRDLWGRERRGVHYFGRIELRQDTEQRKSEVLRHELFHLFGMYCGPGADGSHDDTARWLALEPSNPNRNQH